MSSDRWRLPSGNHHTLAIVMHWGWSLRKHCCCKWEADATWQQSELGLTRALWEPYVTEISVSRLCRHPCPDVSESLLRTQHAAFNHLDWSARDQKHHVHTGRLCASWFTSTFTLSDSSQSSVKKRSEEESKGVEVGMRMRMGVYCFQHSWERYELPFIFC